jgi:hypothetical protein
MPEIKEIGLIGNVPDGHSVLRWVVFLVDTVHFDEVESVKNSERLMEITVLLVVWKGEKYL